MKGSYLLNRSLELSRAGTMSQPLQRAPEALPGPALYRRVYFCEVGWMLVKWVTPCLSVYM